MKLTTPFRSRPNSGAGACGCLVIGAIVAFAAIMVYTTLFPDPGSEAENKARAAIVSQLRDPGSYDEINSRVVKESDLIVVIISYRAKNGFGGYVERSAAFEFTPDGKMIRQR